MLPRIAIVTPSFNQGTFLEACIESVLGQDYSNLEYVIMDGGSTDGSVDIIRKYERHLTYWQSAPDGGHYAAVAEGFARTTGDVMAWLNADDTFCPLAFFKAAYVFAHNSQVEWITSRPLQWAVSGRPDQLCWDTLQHSRERYLRGEFDNPWIQQESTFWRRSLWERAGGGPRHDLQYAGDLELWTRFFRHAQLQVVETLFGGNRRHAGQRSVRFLDDYRSEARAVLDAEAELAAQAPHRVCPAPAPLILPHDGLERFLEGHGVPRALRVADALTNFLLHELVELAADRGVQLESISKLDGWLAESEADRAARLEVIRDLERRLAGAEADRAARLDVIRDLGRRLAGAEADRTAQLEVIRDLERRFAEAESDRTARLDVIRDLERRLAEAEADRTARLDVIRDLERRLAEAEADRTARLGAVSHLTQLLEESEADRTARLDVIRDLERRFAEAEADRAARLDVITMLEARLATTRAEHEVQLRRATADLDQAQQQLRGIETSLSWRMTSPLRWLRQRLLRGH